MFCAAGDTFGGADSVVWRARDKGVGRVFARDGTNSFSGRACSISSTIDTTDILALPALVVSVVHRIHRELPTT